MMEQEARTRERRALLVEDGAVDRMVGEFALKRLGYVPVAADTMGAALAAWEAGRFDLVLLDMHLPDGEGWDVAAELRRRERAGQRTPIVALSGCAEPEDRERCLAAGADEFLTKPLDATALARVTEGLARTAPTATGAAGGGAAVDGPGPIDLAQLDEATMGSAELREMIVATFLGDVRPRLETLARAVAAGDARSVEFEAHGLKGMSATLGARSCAARFAELERLGREKSIAGAPPLLERAGAEVAAVERFFGGADRKVA